MEKWTHNRIVYDGSVFRVRVGEVELDDGTPAQREVIDHPGGVGVIPFTGSSVLLVRQFRIAIGRTIVEMPAGKLEAGEAPEACGQRELNEETGYHAGRLVPAGAVYATVGYCSELIHLFLALDLRHIGETPDHEERIELVEMPLADVRAGLRRHEFEDAKTVVGLHALLQHLDGAV